MSRAAKATLLASVLFCGASVVGVHYIQNTEKENLRAGVIRDEERRQKKEQQRNNMKELNEQRELHEALLKTQDVSRPPSNKPIDKDD